MHLREASTLFIDYSHNMHMQQTNDVHKMLGTKTIRMCKSSVEVQEIVTWNFLKTYNYSNCTYICLPVIHLFLNGFQSNLHQ